MQSQRLGDGLGSLCVARGRGENVKNSQKYVKQTIEEENLGKC